MSSHDDRGDKKSKEGLVKAVATVAAATAVAAGGGVPGVATAAAKALVPGLATGLLSVAADAKRKRNERALDAWLAELAAKLHFKSAEEADAFIRENIDLPYIHDGVIGAARTILQDPDEAVIPVLARVIALQFEEKRTDPRTRRLLSMLAECDNDLLVAFQRVLGACAESWGDAGESLELVVEPEPGGFRATRFGAPGRAFFHGEGWLPVLGALRRFGFLQDALPGLAEREPSDVVLSLIHDDFDYLVERLGADQSDDSESDPLAASQP